MKRNLTLVRNILIDVEECPPGQIIQGFTYDNVDPMIIAEHVRLLIDEGYLEGDVVRQLGSSQFAYVVTGMTWDGHEFLANAKNDTVWKKVIADAEAKGSSISMTVLNGLLTQAAKKYFGLD